ncbi:MAG TPA: GGDEF domain-containing response regulator [Rariglobus sp.]|jgi:diguanylate cyclase (GGDEF)-like protein|nr:GGDEF domain-containing response regulator [Rariglobus sp.]
MLRRILLIDDDRLQFRLTEKLFQSFHGEQFTLDWSSSYEDGLPRLLSGDYAVCLLDYQLGARDGLSLIAEAIEAGCTTPIIFLTAETSANIDIAAMKAGALDYLVKGEITPGSLERSLRYALQLSDTLRQLKQLATRDELTGLLNRREFDRMLAEEMERARRFGRSLALVMCDLDHFKSVNDAHGHPAGDAVLKVAATTLLAGVRSIDRVARVGGEEFALLLMETTAAEAVGMAERMVAAMRAQRIVVADGAELTVTLSAGVAIFPVHGAEPAALIKAADKALYAAKHAGRDRATSA